MKTLFLFILLNLILHAADFNISTVKKIAKDFPVTETRCKIEQENDLERMISHYLSMTTPSFPEEGVVKYEYITTSKYPYDDQEFKIRIIKFMFKDSETCNSFMNEFDAKTDFISYNECKTKAFAKYRAIRDQYVNKELEKAGLAERKYIIQQSKIRQIMEVSRKAEQSTVVQTAYYTYLRKMKQCEWLIKYD